LVGGVLIESEVEIEDGLFDVFGEVDFLSAFIYAVLILADDHCFAVFDRYDVGFPAGLLFFGKWAFTDCD
jgi:hypothetical protein